MHPASIKRIVPQHCRESTCLDVQNLLLSSAIASWSQDLPDISRVKPPLLQVASICLLCNVARSACALRPETGFEEQRQSSCPASSIPNVKALAIRSARAESSCHNRACLSNPSHLQGCRLGSWNRKQSLLSSVTVTSNHNTQIVGLVPKIGITQACPSKNCRATAHLTAFRNSRADMNVVLAVRGSASANPMLGNGSRSTFSINRRRYRGHSAFRWAPLQRLDMNCRLHRDAEPGSGVAPTTVGTKVRRYMYILSSSGKVSETAAKRSSHQSKWREGTTFSRSCLEAVLNSDVMAHRHHSPGFHSMSSIQFSI
ncbi:uncharacterized protein M421DRAFT_424897 [Didymella exigua CBS 183.55]|uniref:Uncharacterized protein n=1 Tax=Didymella exigua CBS 183.55 TaxID=1150837 RepID=A0A6A5REX7_9PLEO|nr:uncharacterized protein M421DRAFT_424897 [Didymella exigua CBS 183.55]KAF1924257.1 hypothetical protein M421DRAFT_424897 [Didymella exigua CBS 183.55]